MKKNQLIAIATLLSLMTSFTYASGHGWSCAPGTPKAIEKGITEEDAQNGASDWGHCYIDSALEECKAGETIVKIQCTPEALTKGMHNAVRDADRYCKLEQERLYLPDGVDLVQCKHDWVLYDAHPVA